PACDRGHAALHPDQGVGPRGRRGAGARSRCRALSAGRDRPLARRRRRAPEAAVVKGADHPCGRCAARRNAHDGGFAMTTALELRDVSKIYDAGPTEVHALTQVNLTVERGELVAAMGPPASRQHPPPTTTPP